MNGHNLLSTTRQNAFNRKFKLEWFESLPSTQTHLINLPKSSNTIIVARKQTDGIGRYGKWHNTSGSLMCSIDSDCAEFEDVTYLKVLNGLKQAFQSFDIQVELKWPNDLILNVNRENFKICGVLIDWMVQGEERRCILGIGVDLGFSGEFFEPRTISIHSTSSLGNDKSFNSQKQPLELLRPDLLTNQEEKVNVRRKEQNPTEFYTVRELTGVNISPVHFLQSFLYNFYHSTSNALDGYNLPDFVNFKGERVKVVDKKEFKIEYKQSILVVNETEWGYDLNRNEVVQKKFS